MSTLRICKVCNQEKEINQFFPKGNNRFLKSCKLCYSNQLSVKYHSDREFRQNEINRTRKLRWARYGATPEEIYETLEEQKYQCANSACRKQITLDPFETEISKAHTDHDHAKNKFRALLCSDCNALLGRIEKNPNQVMGLMKYLESFK